MADFHQNGKFQAKMVKKFTPPRFFRVRMYDWYRHRGRRIGFILGHATSELESATTPNNLLGYDVIFLHLAS